MILEPRGQGDRESLRGPRVALVCEGGSGRGRKKGREVGVRSRAGEGVGEGRKIEGDGARNRSGEGRKREGGRKVMQKLRNFKNKPNEGGGKGGENKIG